MLADPVSALSHLISRHALNNSERVAQVLAALYVCFRTEADLALDKDKT